MGVGGGKNSKSMRVALTPCAAIRWPSGSSPRPVSYPSSVWFRSLPLESLPTRCGPSYFPQGCRSRSISRTKPVITPDGLPSARIKHLRARLARRMGESSPGGGEFFPCGGVLLCDSGPWERKWPVASRSSQGIRLLGELPGSRSAQESREAAWFRGREGKGRGEKTKGHRSSGWPAIQTRRNGLVSS